MRVGSLRQPAVCGGRLTMRSLRPRLMLQLLLALGLSGAAATARVDAVAIDPANAVRVDGALSEETWRGASAVDAFLQREPREGGEPAQRTEFRVAYSATTLYVKVHAFDN